LAEIPRILSKSLLLKRQPAKFWIQNNVLVPLSNNCDNRWLSKVHVYITSTRQWQLEIVHVRLNCLFSWSLFLLAHNYTASVSQRWGETPEAVISQKDHPSFFMWPLREDLEGPASIKAAATFSPSVQLIRAFTTVCS
jgi:hypothetical protein